MDGKRIQSITEKGITYLDENGAEKFIDFAVCSENDIRKHLQPAYLARYKELNKLTDEDLENAIEKFKQSKVVADRNILGTPTEDNVWGNGIPYIEFYTEPPCRFEFENEKAFRHVQYTIAEWGWMTFDLS